MTEDSVLNMKLAEAGADTDMISQYQHYRDIGNIQGQERLISRCRRLKNEELNKEREQLACLDYMIAKLEKAYGE